MATWEEMSMEDQAMLLAYSQIREDEDAKAEGNRLAAAVGSRAISF